MSISNLITRHARYRPGHLAVVFEDQRFTYEQFNRRINRLANAMLALGVTRGERVATFLPNCLELLEIYWASAKLGVAVVPLSPMLLAPGLSSLLGDSEAVLLFTNSALRPVADKVRNELTAQLDGRCILVDGDADSYLNYATLTSSASQEEPPFVEVQADDVYNIMYTSGTTGLPKGIVLTHQIRANYGVLLANSFRMTPESVVLHTGSIVFNGAFATLIACVYLGATYILHRQFDVDALIDTVQREKVTHTMMVPSQIIAMMASPNFSPAAMQSMEMILSLGAPLHQESKEHLNRDLPGRFYELYGLTEGFLTILDRTDAIRKQGSVGVPPPFSDMRIVKEDGELAATGEIGEIVGRSPFQMPGYFKRPDLTAAALKNGWLHSGDLGYVDEDGFLYLVDRKKDMIDSGGVKVYPRDVEEVAMRHPLVLEVAVFGIPHDKWGETPIAAAVLKKPGTISADDLKDWINAHVSARFQRVQEVVILDEFPRSAAGKILKRELRDPYWANHGRKI